MTVHEELADLQRRLSAAQAAVSGKRDPIQDQAEHRARVDRVLGSCLADVGGREWEMRRVLADASELAEARMLVTTWEIEVTT